MSATEAVKRPLPRPREKNIGRGAAVHAAYFVTGVLVSRGAMLGSLSPFGASFAAAIPFGYLPSGLLGAAVSYLLLSPVDTFRYIAVIVAIGALRWALGELKRLTSSRIYPAAVAFVPMLATGIALTFSARSELTEIYECVIEALLSAAGAYFMSRTAALSGNRRALGGMNQQELACVTMTGCILLLSLGSLTIGSVSVGRVLAFSRGTDLSRAGASPGSRRGLSFPSPTSICSFSRRDTRSRDCSGDSSPRWARPPSSLPR